MARGSEEGGKRKGERKMPGSLDCAPFGFAQGKRDKFRPALPPDKIAKRYLAFFRAAKSENI